MKLLPPALLFALCFSWSGDWSVSAAESDAPKETLSATVDYTLTPAASVPDNSFTPLCSGGGKTFIVFRDDKLHPWVTEIPDGGEASAVLLDPADAGNPRKQYVAQYRDPQHSYSIGIDKKGYLHIAGDMHGYPGSNDRFLPGRYYRKIILYWKSNSPYTVKDGFTFVGNDVDKAIPGKKWSYGGFYSDNNGELYFTAHVVAIGGKQFQNPEEGIGLYHYDADKGAWTALGAEPPHSYPNAEYYPVLFWNFPGGPTIAKENHGTLHFDRKNRMHFTVPAASDASAIGLNSLVYACSEDGGKTWRKADGKPIADLPMRAVGPNQADVAVSFNAYGLLMRSYASKDCTGQPTKVRIAPILDFCGDIKAQSARWTGELVCRDEGATTLEMTTNGDSNLNLIKFQKGIMDFSTSMKVGDSYTVTLEKNQTVGLDIQWRKTAGSGVIALYWTTPGHRKEQVPQQYLIPGHTRFDLFASVFTDKDGTPGIACSPSNSLENGWRYWDKAAKAWGFDYPFPGVSKTFNKAYLGSDNSLLFESNNGIMHYSKAAYQYVQDPVVLTRAEGFDRPMQRYNLAPYTVVWGADEQAFRKSNLYRAIAFDEKKQLWCVVRIQLPPLR